MTSLATILYAGMDPQASLRRELRPLVAPVPDALPDAIHDLHEQTATGVAELLAMPVGNLALAAWDKHRRVRLAREQTRRRPLSHQVVRLLDHTIRSKQTPNVELEVGGTNYRLLTLTLEVEIVVTGVNLTVEHGQITRIRPGPAKATATLSVGEVRLGHGSLDMVSLQRDQPQRNARAARAPAVAQA